MALYLRNSPARRKFKKMLGSANHLIITALVGLDAIEQGIVVDAPAKFPASWAPRNRSRSASRSRRLILEMALLRSVDALDTYFSWINRKPFLVQSRTARAELDSAGRSVSARLKVIESHFAPADRLLSALAMTMIAWRNKAVHSEHREALRDPYIQILQQHADEVADRFCGLKTEILLDGYSINRTPRMKEVTSFISATHEYIQCVDGNIIKVLQPEQYLKGLVWTGVLENDVSDKNLERERKRLIHNKWGVSLCRRRQAILGFLHHKGLTTIIPPENEPYLVFEKELLDRLICKTPDEVYRWASPS